MKKFENTSKTVIIKKTCLNCKNYIKLKSFCTVLQTLEPRQGFCPQWHINTHMITIPLLRNYDMEE